MMEWWGALTLELQIFYGVGILATVLLVIQLIMNMVGAGDDGGGLDLGGGDHAILDGAPDLEHGSGLGLVSARTVIAFLAGFGWTGALARTGGLGLLPSVLAALVVGFGLMLLIFWLMRGLYSLRQSGTLDYRNAVGAVGTVYVKVPAAGEGTGQIQVVVQGRLATVAAATEGAAAIASGRQVKVVKLLAGNTVLVEAI
ncbi:MAG TPA: hypothetical protein PLL30_12150 [Candidatus Krumholzibacteria bacterium]|nr:hypothetical protein [Candidatus Krumholzibacteria bacterium]HPD72520.1 hypothetical protein [Candidatus Krumholzibacteria bacterium]HRY40548.1 hypothetical protein [Candidatus Krumholzibacteria bacterium]